MMGRLSDFYDNPTEEMGITYLTKQKGVYDAFEKFRKPAICYLDHISFLYRMVDKFVENSLNSCGITPESYMPLYCHNSTFGSLCLPIVSEGANSAKSRLQGRYGSDERRH